MKLYVYANLIARVLSTTEVNFWSDADAAKTGIYSDGNTVTFQLLEIREIDLSNINFDFVSGKIQALELQLGNLHVKSENIKAQIQELKCIGHETQESEQASMEDSNHYVQFDDDIPF